MPQPNPRSVRLGLIFCSALLAGFGLAAFVPAAPPSVADDADPQKMRQSQEIVRLLQAYDAPLVCAAHRLEIPAALLSIDCASASGQHLANLTWDRRTGALVSLSRPLHANGSEPGGVLSEGFSPASHPEGEMVGSLTEAQASACAVRWLHRLGVFAPGETRLRVSCRRAALHWDFRIASSRRQVRALVERRTGEIVLVDVLRADGLPRYALPRG